MKWKRARGVSYGKQDKSKSGKPQSNGSYCQDGNEDPEEFEDEFSDEDDEDDDDDCEENMAGNNNGGEHFRICGEHTTFKQEIK